MEEAITGDYALIKAWKGDCAGNLVFKLVSLINSVFIHIHTINIHHLILVNNYVVFNLLYNNI